MSLIKIDGHILSVTDMYKWISIFVNLHRRGKIREKGLPAEIIAALRTESDEKAVESIVTYIGGDEEFIGKLISIVRDIAPDIALEKESRS